MEQGKSATGRVKAEHGKDHHRGLDDALQAALDNLSSEVGTGDYPVDVRFWLDVEVSNPGKVGFYCVTLTRTD